MNLKFLVKPLFSASVIVPIAMSLVASAVSARSGDLEVTTGQGEGVAIKHNIFGQKSYAAQDRIGDKIERRNGLLGSSTDIQLLGNGYQTSRGLGNKSVKVNTMLGDSIESKRGWFGLGRRKTKVNLSGTTGLIQQAFKHKTASTSLGAMNSTFDNSANASSTGSSNTPLNMPGDGSLPAYPQGSDSIDTGIDTAFPTK